MSLQLFASPFKIGVIPKSTETNFWKKVRDGAKKAGEDFNAHVVWVGQRHENQTQEGFIKRMIESELIDAIVIAPNQKYDLQPILQQVKANKIKLVIIDSEIKNIEYDAFIATDNYQAGVDAASYMAKHLNKNSSIAVMRFRKGNASTSAREEGFITQIKKLVNANIAFDSYMGPTKGSAYHKSIELIDFAKIDGVFSPNETMTVGLLKAINKTKNDNTPVIVGFDTNEYLEEGVMQGKLKGLIVQQPFQMGYLGVKTAVDLLKGKQIKKSITLPIKIITARDIPTVKDF
ncbi:substrate-binding domain-containing protein [Zooshikella ganghwensis]|nr:substrate-binding domain-containing protein [Zooshikella ganghwensis]